MVDYLEILRLSSDPKNSQRCIASIVHCSRHTIRAVLEAAKKAGLSWRKRQTSPRIKGRHLKETVAHWDGGQLFLRYIAFFRGICGKQAFSPCFVSFAQLRRSLQDPQQVSVRI